MERMEALAKFLGIETEEGETLEDYISASSWDENQLEAEGKTFLVVTDEEADQAAMEYVKTSLWAFNASFLSERTGLPEEVFTAMQDKCEDANETFLELVEKFDSLEEFTKAAIGADGRGHFLSQYDGNENEEGEYFIYRTN